MLGASLANFAAAGLRRDQTIRSLRIALANSSGWVSETICRAPAISENVAPGISRKPFISWLGVDASDPPTMIWVGTPICPRRLPVSIVASACQPATQSATKARSN